jgi:hypothetical protein
MRYHHDEHISCIEGKRMRSQIHLTHRHSHQIRIVDESQLPLGMPLAQKADKALVHPAKASHLCHPYFRGFIDYSKNVIRGI